MLLSLSKNNIVVRRMHRVVVVVGASLFLSSSSLLKCVQGANTTTSIKCQEEISSLFTNTMLTSSIGNVQQICRNATVCTPDNSVCSYDTFCTIDYGLYSNTTQFANTCTNKLGGIFHTYSIVTQCEQASSSSSSATNGSSSSSSTSSSSSSSVRRFQYLNDPYCLGASCTTDDTEDNSTTDAISRRQEELRLWLSQRPEHVGCDIQVMEIEMISSDNNSSNNNNNSNTTTTTNGGSGGIRSNKTTTTATTGGGGGDGTMSTSSSDATSSGSSTRTTALLQRFLLFPTTTTTIDSISFTVSTVITLFFVLVQ